MFGTRFVWFRIFENVHQLCIFCDLRGAKQTRDRTCTQADPPISQSLLCAQCSADQCVWSALTLVQLLLVDVGRPLMLVKLLLVGVGYIHATRLTMGLLLALSGYIAT